MFVCRTAPDLHKLDLTDFGTVTAAITKFKPTFIIHSAAQRFPDKVSSNPEAARRLNVDATFHLADTAGFLPIFPYKFMCLVDQLSSRLFNQSSGVVQYFNSFFF